MISYDCVQIIVYDRNTYHMTVCKQKIMNEKMQSNIEKNVVITIKYFLMNQISVERVDIQLNKKKKKKEKKTQTKKS